MDSSRSGERRAVPYFCQWESAHRAGEIIRQELRLEDDPASVSYTHLDVYKRQGHTVSS